MTPQSHTGRPAEAAALGDGGDDLVLAGRDPPHLLLVLIARRVHYSPRGCADRAGWANSRSTW